MADAGRGWTKTGVCIAVLICLAATAPPVLAQIPAAERAALIELYNSTNGPGWTDSTGWLGPAGTECGWYGVSCNGENVFGIRLSNNQLTGTIPPELGSLTNLFVLILDYNQLTGTIPSELGGLGDLWTLSLVSNQLTGTIPSEFGSLTNLGNLDLSYNELTGTIPAELGNLGYLRRLELDYNQLTGTIPAQLGNLASLQILGLSTNQLTGDIPTQLGNLTDLQYLNLDDNRLTGAIPNEFGGLANLVTLALQKNRVSGSIPSEFWNLNKLVFLRLGSNKLTGDVPSSLLSLTNLANAGSDFRWNGIHTTDATLRAFLNSKQSGGDWESTQTIAPTNLVVPGVGTDFVDLSWTPIVYTGDGGGYRVLGATVSGGPYTPFGITANKADTGIRVTGLAPMTPYYFVVESETQPHANNQNTVISERTNEIQATTLALVRLNVDIASFENGVGSVRVVPPDEYCAGIPGGPVHCEYWNTPGATVTLEALPVVGSVFQGWIGACSGKDSCTVKVDDEMFVGAEFRRGADLRVTKTASDRIVGPGARVVYTVRVSNAGPLVATAVALVDTLPPDATFVSSLPGAPTCDHSGPTPGGTVTCALGDLGVATEAVVTIEVDAPSDPGELVNTATASSGVPDQNLANDSASVMTVVYEDVVVNEVLSFTATTRAGSGEATLEWLNPNVAEYESTYVRYATGTDFSNCNAPAPDGGTLLTTQARAGDYDTYVHGGLDENLVYCYSVYVYQGSGRLSRAKTVRVRPILAGGNVVWGYSVDGMPLAPPGFGAEVYIPSQGVYSMLYGMRRGVSGGDRPAGWDHVALGDSVQHRPVTVPMMGTYVTLLSQQGGLLRAVDGTTGAAVWTSANLGSLQGMAAAWLRAYGADQDLVLTGTRLLAGDNKLYAHDPTVAPNQTNGVWTVQAPAHLVGAINGGPSLDYATKRLFFATRQHPSNLATVWCVSLVDGSVLWSKPYGNITGVPTYRRGRVYVGNDQGVVYALDATNGNEVWRYDTKAVMNDGAVNWTVFLDRLGDDLHFSTDTQVWSLSEVEVPLPGAMLNWRVDLSPNAPSPPLLHTGTKYLYVGANDGRLRQIDVNDGSVIELPLGDGVATVGTPAVDTVSGLVYVGTETGIVYAVQIPMN